MTEPISVDETANWVAMYRAIESDRPDALFKDPFARKLAGPRGEEIMRKMEHSRTYAWPMIVRTKVMDDIIDRLIAEGVDLVVNLAAGLDARPYRLALPPTLRWVEVDFPKTIEYKTAALAGARPVCRLERHALDLADVAARRVFLSSIGAQAHNALVITEGLLVYLSAEQVGSLADDLAAAPGIAWWLTDLASPFVLKMMQRSWGKSLAAGRAPFQFAPENGAEFLGPHGWRFVEYHSLWVEGHRLQREPFVSSIFRLLMWRMWRQEQTRTSGPMAGVVLLRRGGSPLV
jgi:methyltransferase (TIGR00027 family)